LEELGHPERHFVSVHIGGSNGKGSVAAMVYGALRVAGWRVGLYTSPHLVDVRERMLVNDRPISREAFAMWTERLKPVIEEIDASFFEATTAMAFADFAARGVDIAVVEVGLGGRLDSTNVILPLVSGVTRISLEHTDYLGPTLEGIAREKAGIAKPGVPFVVGEADPGLAAILEQRALEAGARVIRVPPGEVYRGPLALYGEHQGRNAAVAKALLEALPRPYRPDELAVRKGLAKAVLPGRFERRGKWIFDVAHNPDGIGALVAAIRSAAPRRPLHALVGILKDKDWKEMLALLAGVADRLFLCQPPTAPQERRWSLEEVGEWASSWREKGGMAAIEIEPDFEVALEAVQEGAANVVVTGSFHTVGDAMARLPGFAPLG
jgi:dihydrofolate synthase/folylpolyglutamate synthase